MVYVLEEIAECYNKLDDKTNYTTYRNVLLTVKTELYQEKHPGETYKDVILVRGKDNEKPAWHYILIENEDKYQSITKTKSGTNIDVSDFGRILESGFGHVPSKSIMDKINREYGFEPDF